VRAQGIENIKELYDLVFIGKGAFGQVYKAVERSTNHNIYAIKEISKHLLIQEEKATENLKREIINMMNLEHPNIVKIHKVYETSKNYYLVIE